MASTELDVYRPFAGRRGLPRAAWWTIGMSDVRGGLRGKLALFLLYTPVAIATVIFSFVVYMKFALQAGMAPGAPGVGADGGALIGMIGSRASQMIEVRYMVVMMNVALATFALMPVGWYGAGLIAEDRRLGAHLLYFSRPIGRFDYLAGKLVTVSVFGAFAMLVPVLVIFAVAAFASPEWAFVRLEGDVIWRGLANAAIWTLASGSIVLGVSSVCERKSFALIAFFALFMLSQAVSVVLGGLQGDPRWLALGLPASLGRISQDVLGGLGPGDEADLGWPGWWSWTLVSSLVLVSLAIAERRVRRMEVAA